MGNGGGIITRKLLLTVFLIASLSFSGISSASALEQGTIQTPSVNTNNAKINVDSQTDSTNILNETATMQKTADNSEKMAPKANNIKETEHSNEQLITQNKNTETPTVTSVTSDSTVNQSQATVEEAVKTANIPVSNSTTTNLANTNSTPITDSNSENTNITETNPQNADSSAVNTDQNSTNTVNNSESNQITEKKEATTGTYTNIRGVWLKAEDVANISVSELKNANITDIFVKANKATTPSYPSVLKDITTKLKDSGIRIHAWITCFKDADGKWVDPANATHRAEVLETIKDITRNYQIDGIHLDYVRYSGVGDNAAYKHEGAATITSFVKDVNNAVKSIKANVAVSASLMPEGSKNANTYGQDYKALAPYLDFLVPMIYKGNYGQDNKWIGSTTKYIVEQTGGKPVIVGIQTYLSDYDTSKLSGSELNQDIKSATNNGASGFVLFRYGTLSKDFINPPSFTLNEIDDAASKIKSYIETNHRLPNFVTIAKQQVSTSEFLNLMTSSISQLNSEIKTPVTLEGISNPQESTGSFTSGSIGKTEYLNLVNKINKFTDSSYNAPGYATSHLGKIKYESLVYMFSKILNFHDTNSKLPNNVSLDSKMKISSSPEDVSKLHVFTLAQIQKSAANIKKYIEANHKLPGYVTVGATKISTTEFLRLMIINTIEVKDGVKAKISLKAVNSPATPSEKIATGDLTKAEYLDIAKRLKAFIDSNGKIPNHITTSKGEMRYESLVYTFAKIVGFENAKSRLPGSVSVKPWSSVSASPGMSVPADLQKYLRQTANAQSNSSRIKSLAASITKGATTPYAKAVKIFNWVRNNIGYSFYYNTKKGALGTLNAKTANCADTAHLVVALSRAAGLPAKYVHGKCRFNSGHWYGHVWARIWVNGKWYTADATSSKNKLGVINNWNKATATIKGTYASLPF